MVNLIGFPGVGHQHGQHEYVITPTPGELLQGDPGRNTLQPEAYRRGKVAPGTREYLLHGYLTIWFQGPLQPNARVPTPRGR